MIGRYLITLRNHPPIKVAPLLKDDLDSPLITRAEGQPMESTVDPPMSSPITRCGLLLRQPVACRLERGAKNSTMEESGSIHPQGCSNVYCPVIGSGDVTRQVFNLYDDTLRRISDNFTPASTFTRRIRRLSPWFDNDCPSSTTGSPGVIGIELYG